MKAGWWIAAVNSGALSLWFSASAIVSGRLAGLFLPVVGYTASRIIFRNSTPTMDYHPDALHAARRSSKM
jgi:hypothetical protein